MCVCLVVLFLKTITCEKTNYLQDSVDNIKNQSIIEIVIDYMRECF